MVASTLASAGLGLASAASWGAADFSGGLATRRWSVVAVTVAARCTGSLLLVVLALGLREPALSGAGVGWACAAGVAGSVGLVALYRALAIGQMGVAAPVSGILSAGLPVLFTAFFRGLPTTLQMMGFGLAMASVWMLSRPRGPAGGPAGFGLALLSGVGFGTFLVLIAQASQSTWLWPLAVANLASLAILLLVAITTRQIERPPSGSLPLALATGVLDVGGNAFFLLAAQVGRLDTAAVLSSLYPAPTALLAWALLRERVSALQAAGVVVALAAIALIAR
jgi:drug/metabolite transporter (DMT)-like permease